MHQSKDIKKLQELKTLFQNKHLADSLLDIIKVFSSGLVTGFVNPFKHQGHSSGTLLTFLLLMPYAMISSIRAFFCSDIAFFSDAQKDAFYRFKNNSDIDWRKLQFMFAKRFKKLIEAKTQEDGPSCFILDDTLISKCSPQNEGVSKVFDQLSKTFFLGYKMLMLAYWDGRSIIP